MPPKRRGKTVIEIDEEARAEQRAIEAQAVASNHAVLNPEIRIKNTNTGRAYLRGDAGGLIEFAGAAMAVTAVYLLVGLGWALLAGGAALLIGAEFVYFDVRFRVPLPKRPHLKRGRK